MQAQSHLFELSPSELVAETMSGKGVSSRLSLWRTWRPRPEYRQ